MKPCDVELPHKMAAALLEQWANNYHCSALRNKYADSSKESAIFLREQFLEVANHLRERGRVRAKAVSDRTHR